MSKKYSDLRGNDLLDLLLKIFNMNLEYRKNIKYDSNITYGIEIEYERIPKFIINKYIKKYYSSWDSVEDLSLDSGGEIVSPIIYGDTNDWNEIESISDHLNNLKANTLDNAGFHIHVGRQIFTTKEELLLFIKTYILYEHIIYRFSYGDKIIGRKKIKDYSPPIGIKLYEMLEELERCESLEELYKLLSKLPRYSSINFTNINSITEKKTIEFRLFNASSNKIVIQNNINCTIKLCESPYNKIIDKEFIDYKISKFEIKDKYMYNNVDLLSALEFVDLIFNKDIDKMYFLRQYLKNFNSSIGLNTGKIIKL